MINFFPRHVFTGKIFTIFKMIVIIAVQYQFGVKTNFSAGKQRMVKDMKMRMHIPVLSLLIRCLVFCVITKVTTRRLVSVCENA